jgi:hypothetical protein
MSRCILLLIDGILAEPNENSGYNMLVYAFTVVIVTVFDIV